MPPRSDSIDSTTNPEIMTSQSYHEGINDDEEPAKIVIVGGGIVGLVLALALKKQIGITPEIYEKAHGFAEDVGAALGMYPNGLRVLRDIDPLLLRAIRDQGYPYLYRRWERHDGTEIAAAKEDILANGDEELYSIGIRRWRLQEVLYRAVQFAGIPLHFQKATADVIERDDDLIEVKFEDGTSRLTQVLFGVDGGKSRVRQVVADPNVKLEYTGVTCLMGISKCPTERRGIHFPSAITSEFHAVYFPTGRNEQCFQIHFPIKEEHSNKEDWGNLSIADGKVKFANIARTMEKDGWAEKYTEPLYQVEHAVRVGFALLNPRLKRWVYGRNRRIVLVGDAAHPPVPYVGQGAQMGIEDAGTIALLIKELCLDDDGNFNLKHFGEATRIYEKLRIPRTSKVLDCSKHLGSMQSNRSKKETQEFEEMMLQGEVMMNETLPVMFTGASHNYAEEVMLQLFHDREMQLGRDYEDVMVYPDAEQVKQALIGLYGDVPFVM